MKVFLIGMLTPKVRHFTSLLALASILAGSFAMASEGEKEQTRSPLTGIESADWQERSHALQSIAKLEHPTSQDLLVVQHALADPSVHVRRVAIKVVRQLGARAVSVLPTLLTVLANKDEDGAVRWDVLDTLKKFSNDPSADILQVLRDLLLNSQEDVVIRFKAMTLLKELSPPAKSLIPILHQLAKDSPHQMLQNQAWLTLGHLEPENDEVLMAIVEIAKGQHGSSVRLQTGVLSSRFDMPRAALRTLLEINQEEKAVPIFLESLERQAKKGSNVKSLASEIGRYLQEHPTNASLYIPDLYEVVQRPPDRDIDYYVRFMLLVTLVQLDPTSPQLKEILQGIVKSDDHPSVIQGAEDLLKCLDPTIAQTQKKQYPCSGHFKPPVLKR